MLIAMSDENQKTVIPITWDTIHRDLQTLAERLRAENSWHGIVAVTRGGLVPAAIIARELDIRLIETICISSYDEQKPGPIDIIKSPTSAVDDQGAGWLVIDDIIDTGATVSAIRDLLPKAFYAALYAKPDTKQLVNIFLHEASPDIWIDFPWEK